MNGAGLQKHYTVSVKISKSTLSDYGHQQQEQQAKRRIILLKKLYDLKTQRIIIDRFFAICRIMHWVLGDFLD